MIFKKIREGGSAPRLVLVGNFGAGNLGDELILAGFLKKISLELPKAQIVVLAGEPKLVRRFHGVDALPHLPTGLRSLLKMNWWRSLGKIRKADAIIFPGGGLFSDEESWRASLLWGAHILIARYFWKPVFLLGQSVGPFKKRWVRWLAKFCLSKTEWIGVRDAGSEAELRRIGISARKIRLGRDAAFWLVSRVPKTRELKRHGVAKILVSVRDFPKIAPQFWNELICALDEIAVKKQAHILFAEFGKGDHELWKKIRRRAKKSATWKTLELPESAEGILKEIKKIDLVIGMRLHALIAAKLVGVPAIGFAYSRKVSEFAEKSFSMTDFRKEKLLKILS
ncbi:MAG: polysaccharide pyruvyl transferase family protein [Patescibacteria group bacterium]